MVKRLLYLALTALAVIACTKEDFGITEIENPRAEKNVTVYGETVTVKFVAEGPWYAELELKSEGEWATISQMKGIESAGPGTVRVRFSKNETESERVAELYVAVRGKDRMLVATFTQSAGENISAMSAALNEIMDKRLREDYLWADDYAKLEIDKTVNYDKFLYTHLTKLGDINIEDGGYYRDYSASAGERYIYSYISEVTSTKAPIVTKAGELTSTFGLGIGPMFASVYESGTDYIGLTIGYIYPGSPAETAGLRRGDTIYKMGSTRITRSNYQSVMQELFYSPSGTYDIVYARYEANDAAERYDLVQDKKAEVTAASYGYNPIIYAAILTNSELSSDNSASDLPPFNIGYMASESFDATAQEVMDYQIKQFIDAGITELILDLRFNVGGEVQQSRYLASSIVGRDYDDKIFFKAKFRDGKIEEWPFKSGPSESDKLGVAPSMGLKRLWVIMSENTASASELIINALKGVDFPITLIGSRSEGKNVGMEVTHEMYNGRRFEFAPITYWGLNGKDEHAPKDGFMPDSGNILNNQNSNYSDDIDNMFPYAFGDWGNFDFNIPFYCCFCDILGIDRPDYQAGGLKSGVSVTDGLRLSARQIGVGVEPVGVSELRPEIGRFGNVIYRD
ncbi:MAG: peptidase S41 [Bacteroidales bacterium]|nr:peptidase S41 [Bacteroidales bacterium]